MKDRIQIKLLLIFLSCVINSAAYSQVNEFVLKRGNFLFQTVTERGGVTFNDEQPVMADKVFELYPEAFGLEEGCAMEPAKTTHDQKGNIHIKYQQLYHEIPIYGAEYMIHGVNNFALSGNGKIFSTHQVNSDIQVTEEQALQILLNDIHASKYYWEDSLKELSARDMKKNGVSTYYPHAEKIFLPDPETYHIQLTYAFRIYTFDTGKSGQYFMDTRNGKVLKFKPADLDCSGTSFESNWYGNKNLSTHFNGDEYELENDCNASVYGVYNVEFDNDIYTSGNNTWTSSKGRSAATSLWGIKRTYFAYLNKFGIHGHDDDDGNLDIYQGYNFGGDNPNDNASYSYDAFGDDEINVGLSTTDDGTDDWNSIDIMGHEFTHGVTTYTANLEYEGESGALNESFSDIFGEWVESIELGAMDWFNGKDRINSNGCALPIRYFVDPAKIHVPVGGGCTRNFNQPNTYGGTNWISTSGCDPDDNNDQCGVHRNSGVQNQMFYLLVVGGFGRNSGTTCHDSLGIGYNWSVDGIGIDHAIEIAYATLTDYLGSTSDYGDARDAWVQAATFLFGACSPEAVATGKAWYAVGINPPSIVNTVICNEAFGNSNHTEEAAGSLLTGTNCTVIITNGGGQVNFKAGNAIILKSGFDAVVGSKFRALLTDCEFAVY